MRETSLSEFEPLASDKPLIVYIDIKSPYAFIAKDPTWALADELGIEIDWRPLTLDIPSYLGSAKLDNSGKVAQSNRSAEQWGGVRYAYMDARRYAAAYGYALRGTEKIWDTRLIHIAFLWVKRAGMAELRKFIDAVYPPFWIRELDVEDEQTVIRCIEQAGVASAGFLEWASSAGGQAHDEQQAAVFDAGVYGVPGYVVDGEYFFGREHLPTIRNRLIARRDKAAVALVDIGNSLPSVVELERNAAGEANKAAVFHDMRQAAQAGRLEIVAGVNSTCAQSAMALRELERLSAAHPGRLRIRWGELPCREPAPPPAPPPGALKEASASRGDRHRALRAQYQFEDLERYRRQLVAKSLPTAFEPIVYEPEATQLLQDNGVKQSFGFVYQDKHAVLHPFNGRQHLAALFWAVS